MIATDNLTAIGQFGRPHGLKGEISAQIPDTDIDPGSYTHLRAHETGRNLVCRFLLEKKVLETASMFGVGLSEIGA